MFKRITLPSLVPIFWFSSILVGYAADSVAGRWEGSVRIPGRDLKLIVDLDKDSAEKWRGSIIMPGCNVNGVALDDLSVTDADVSFALKTTFNDPQGAPTTAKLHLSADQTLSGDFTEAGNTASLILNKTGPPQVEVPPKSTGITQELVGTWKGQYELFGYPRQVTVKFATKPDGDAAVEFVVVGKKTTNVPIDLITQSGNLVTLDSHAFGMSYDGRFDKSAGEIKGVFLQGPFEIPLVLKRSSGDSK
jgi:hypothetical protein